ncbi:MAG TPA: hypothetical protein PKM43_03205 [Verrucomicrobiota bacterium]|nr:hypothetical protein [Verrucomicrobiota bacterium]HRZ37702.1 hypothetical protein [Candidatus Paceibacterota bacterium]HRZ56846.1 hypothetical protein [Candidatus Paceibacterota bacterium]
MNTPHDRGTFIKSTAALAALAAWPMGCPTLPSVPQFKSAPRPKRPATIQGAFFYPAAEDVLAGKAEDSWAPHQWFALG